VIGPGGTLLFSTIGQSYGFFKYGGEHLPGELPGLSILVGRVVGGQQDLAIRHRVPGTVPELVRFLAPQLAPALQVVQVGLESNSAQSHNHFQILQPIHFAIEIRRAVGQFLRQRLVVGRRTARGCGDIEIPQFEAICAVNGRGLVGKPRLEQNRIHEFARSIASKRTPRAIRSVCPGRQAEHQYPSFRIAEAGDGFAPIVATEVGAAFLSRNFLPIFDQPGTASAGNDFAVQLIKPGGHL